MKKRIFSLLFALIILCYVPLMACAHDVPRERSDCSIEVTVRYAGKDINGGTLTAIRVGYVDQEDGNFFFRRVMDDVVLDNIQNADAADELREFYKDNKNLFDFYKQTVKVENGKAKFSDLSTGLYLIIQEKAARGYSKMKPFLVSVPYLENGEYQYHVTAAIKSELERAPAPTAPPPTTPSDSRLPQTGQLNWPIPLMIASGLMLFAAGWVLRFGNKRERHEK